MRCRPAKERRSVPWCPPPFGILKLNMVEASRNKSGAAGIGGALPNSKGGGVMFSKHVSVIPMKWRS